MYNGALIVDSYDVVNCSVDEVLPSTYNSAFYIEGLAVLANVTGDRVWLEL